MTRAVESAPVRSNPLNTLRTESQRRVIFFLIFETVCYKNEASAFDNVRLASLQVGSRKRGIRGLNKLPRGVVLLMPHTQANRHTEVDDDARAQGVVVLSHFCRKSNYSQPHTRHRAESTPAARLESEPEKTLVNVHLLTYATRRWETWRADFGACHLIHMNVYGNT